MRTVLPIRRTGKSRNLWRQQSNTNTFTYKRHTIIVKWLVKWLATIHTVTVNMWTLYYLCRFTCKRHTINSINKTGDATIATIHTMNHECTLRIHHVRPNYSVCLHHVTNDSNARGSHVKITHDVNRENDSSAREFNMFGQGSYLHIYTAPQISGCKYNVVILFLKLSTISALKH